MKNTKINLLLLGMFFLVGCAHFQPKPTFKYIPWKNRQIKLQQNKNWMVSGAISITHNKKRDIARFEWEQNQNDYVINLSGPMNTNRVEVIGNSNKVQLCHSGNKCVFAKSAEKLFLNEMGWKLPISNIRYWALSLPTPAKIDKQKFDEYGHLIELVQQGWKINYSEFYSIKNIDLPSIIELRNNEFFIKLKINHIHIS